MTKNELITAVISGLALLVSAYSALIAQKAKKESHIANTLSNEANEISGELKKIEEDRDKDKIENERLRIAFMLLQYFIINFQRCDWSGSTYRVKDFKTAEGKAAQANYRDELVELSLAINELFKTSFYFNELVEVDQLFPYLPLFLRKEAMFVALHIEQKKTWGISNEVVPIMFNLLEKVKQDLSQKRINIIEKDQFKEYYMFAENLSKSLPKQPI